MGGVYREKDLGGIVVQLACRLKPVSGLFVLQLASKWCSVEARFCLCGLGCSSEFHPMQLNTVSASGFYIYILHISFKGFRRFYCPSSLHPAGLNGKAGLIAATLAAIVQHLAGIATEAWHWHCCRYPCEVSRLSARHSGLCSGL